MRENGNIGRSKTSLMTENFVHEKISNYGKQTTLILAFLPGR
jgi:hypothetical protein